MTKPPLWLRLFGTAMVGSVGGSFVYMGAAGVLEGFPVGGSVFAALGLACTIVGLWAVWLDPRSKA